MNRAAPTDDSDPSPNEGGRRPERPMTTSITCLHFETTGDTGETRCPGGRRFDFEFDPPEIAPPRPSLVAEALRSGPLQPSMVDSRLLPTPLTIGGPVAIHEDSRGRVGLDSSGGPR